MVTVLRLTSQRIIDNLYFNLSITRATRIWEWRDLLTSTFKYLNDVNLSFSIINSYHMKYIIIPSVILSIIAIISLDPKLWMTSDVHHFYFEIMAVVLSTVVAFYCITRSYSLNEKFSLFIGIGFLTIAIIDFLHATLSFNADGKYSITIADVSGKVLQIKTGVAVKGTNVIQLDVSKYASGLYLVTITDGKNRKQTLRLNKE